LGMEVYLGSKKIKMLKDRSTYFDHCALVVLYRSTLLKDSL